MLFEPHAPGDKVSRCWVGHSPMVAVPCLKLNCPTGGCAPQLEQKALVRKPEDIELVFY